MCSLVYFLNETDPGQSNQSSLFEVKLELDVSDELNSEIIFQPSMFPGEGFLKLINELMRNVFDQGSLIPRVAAHLKKDNYHVIKIEFF